MLCAVFTTSGNSCFEIGLWGFFLLSFFFFLFILKSQTEEPPGLLTMKLLDATMRRYNTIRPQGNLTDTQRTHATLGIATPPPQLSHNTGLLKTVVGPMFEWAKSVSTPWGKTYIHETYKSHRLTVCVLVWLYKTVLLRAAPPANVVCALQPPCPTGMECLETSLLRSNLTYS